MLDLQVWGCRGLPIGSVLWPCLILVGLISVALSALLVNIMDIKGGHRILYRDYIRVLTKVLIWAPRPFGQPIIWTVAHMGSA